MNFLEILGFLVGLLYLYWEYHANRYVWLASVVMPLISMWIYFSKGLYADFAINIYYFAIAIYGFIVWTRPRSHRTQAEVNSPTEENLREGRGSRAEEDSQAMGGSRGEAKPELPISHTPLPVWFGIALASLLLWAGIWWVLVEFTNSTVPVPDAFTTALSIVALWMMARKYAEQWLLWFVVDLVCSGLYFYKGIPFYGILYAIYTVIAIFGYRKWLRMMKPSGATSGNDSPGRAPD